MNFEDERFVKIYPRNTTNWKLLGWEGRCVLMMLLREVDRAGCLDLEGGRNPDWIYYRDPVHIGTGLTWRSPIHMPRWASRITLRVTDIRVERVQEITEADAMAEGATRRDSGWSLDWSRVGELSRFATASAVKGRDLAALSERDIALGTARTAFGNRWDAINAKRGFSWDSNPWVWVVAFAKLEELSGE
jgi:hypothetical protein